MKIFKKNDEVSIKANINEAIEMINDIEKLESDSYEQGYKDCMEAVNRLINEFYEEYFGGTDV